MLIFKNIFSIGSNNKRGLCTFNCFNIAEHYGEDLKQVPKEGIANNAVVKEWFLHKLTLSIQSRTCFIIILCKISDL